MKEALKGTDTEAIKNAQEALTKAFYDISAKLYQQNPGAAQGAGFDPNQAGAQGGADNVYDADYTVVDDEDKK